MKKMLRSVILVMINDAMIRLYIEYMYTTITSTEDLKGCRNVTRKQFKN